MGAQGTTTIDFGAYPGSPDASIAVTGQTSITASSLVEAWIFPTATADHSIDEHIIDAPRVIAGNVSAGVGFTIYGFAQDQRAMLRDQWLNNEPSQVAPTARVEKGDNPYGQWTVAWVWS